MGYLDIPDDLWRYLVGDYLSYENDLPILHELIAPKWSFNVRRHITAVKGGNPNTHRMRCA